MVCIGHREWRWGLLALRRGHQWSSTQAPASQRLELEATPAATWRPVAQAPAGSRLAQANGLLYPPPRNSSVFGVSTVGLMQTGESYPPAPKSAIGFFFAEMGPTAGGPIHNSFPGRGRRAWLCCRSRSNTCMCKITGGSKSVLCSKPLT